MPLSPLIKASLIVLLFGLLKWFWSYYRDRKNTFSARQIWRLMVIDLKQAFFTRICRRPGPRLRLTEWGERRAQADVERLNCKACSALTARDYTSAILDGRLALQYAIKLLGRNHWLTARILNTLATIEYERNRPMEAKRLWNESKLLASEWPRLNGELIKSVEANLQICRDDLSF